MPETLVSIAGYYESGSNYKEFNDLLLLPVNKQVVKDAFSVALESENHKFMIAFIRAGAIDLDALSKDPLNSKLTVSKYALQWLFQNGFYGAFELSYGSSDEGGVSLRAKQAIAKLIKDSSSSQLDINRFISHAKYCFMEFRFIDAYYWVGKYFEEQEQDDTKALQYYVMATNKDLWHNNLANFNFAKGQDSFGLWGGCKGRLIHENDIYSTKALVRLGFFYYKGKGGTEVNYAMAVANLIKAHQLGSRDSLLFEILQQIAEQQAEQGEAEAKGEVDEHFKVEASNLAATNLSEYWVMGRANQAANMLKARAFFNRINPKDDSAPLTKFFAALDTLETGDFRNGFFMLQNLAENYPVARSFLLRLRLSENPLLATLAFNALGDRVDLRSHPVVVQFLDAFDLIQNKRDVDAINLFNAIIPQIDKSSNKQYNFASAYLFRGLAKKRLGFSNATQDLILAHPILVAVNDRELHKQCVQALVTLSDAQMAEIPAVDLADIYDKAAEFCQEPNQRWRLIVIARRLLAHDAQKLAILNLKYETTPDSYKLYNRIAELVERSELATLNKSELNQAYLHEALNIFHRIETLEGRSEKTIQLNNMLQDKLKRKMAHQAFLQLPKPRRADEFANAIEQHWNLLFELIELKEFRFNMPEAILGSMIPLIDCEQGSVTKARAKWLSLYDKFIAEGYFISAEICQNLNASLKVSTAVGEDLHIITGLALHQYLYLLQYGNSKQFDLAVVEIPRWLGKMDVSSVGKLITIASVVQYHYGKMVLARTDKWQLLVRRKANEILSCSANTGYLPAMGLLAELHKKNEDWGRHLLWLLSSITETNQAISQLTVLIDQGFRHINSSSIREEMTEIAKCYRSAFTEGKLSSGYQFMISLNELVNSNDHDWFLPLVKRIKRSFNHDNIQDFMRCMRSKSQETMRPSAPVLDAVACASAAETDTLDEPGRGCLEEQEGYSNQPGYAHPTTSDATGLALFGICKQTEMPSAPPPGSAPTNLNAATVTFHN